MKNNKVVKKSYTIEEMSNELFIDKDNNFNVNRFAVFVAILVGGICLLAKNMSKVSNDEVRN